MRNLILCLIVLSVTTFSFANHNTLSGRNDLIENGVFLQIPGPNPVISRGPEGSWDDQMLEASDGFLDNGVYYFYYHGAGGGKSYRVGVATATHPLGPYTKYGDGPVLELGPDGSWEDRWVACAYVIDTHKEGLDRFQMFYSGRGSGANRELSGGQPGIGLATAPHPLGPWTKFEGNPLLHGFGYVCAALHVNNQWYLYSAWPISGPDYRGDYSPLAVATAGDPKGPWTIYPGNPLMPAGEWGEWDDGGYSEFEIVFHNGVFHGFYGGTKDYGPRLEHIGYCYSYDGYKWLKYTRNPIASNWAEPNIAAYAEVHAHIEMPFIYLFHTMRPRWRGDTPVPATEWHYDRDKRNPDAFAWIEDLGVQVIVTQIPFSLDYPVLNVSSIGAGSQTELKDSPAIPLSHISKLALTTKATFGEDATKGLVVHVRASYDGVHYDTKDLYTIDVAGRPGKTVQETEQLESNVRFIKVFVTNNDPEDAVTDLKITAHMGG
ncbi:hypothetical protein ACFL1G_11175 [Planctomycetota bacterium]